MITRISILLFAGVGMMSLGCDSRDRSESRDVESTSPRNETLVQTASPVTIRRPDNEPRTPFPNEDGEQSISSKLFQSGLLEMLAETEEGREPKFASNPTQRGLRVQCNLTGRRCVFELVGSSIQPGKPDWGSWHVDGVLIIVDVLNEPIPPRQFGNEAQALKAAKDQLVDEFRREHHFDLISKSEETLKFSTGELAWYGEVATDDPKNAEHHQGIGKFHIGVTLLGRLAVSFAIPAQFQGESAQVKRQVLQRTMLSLERLPDLPADQAPLTADDLRQRGTTLRQCLRMWRSLNGKEYGALVNAELASSRDQAIEGALVLEPRKMMNCLRVYLQAHGAPALTGITVFDGQTAHSVNLDHYEAGTDRWVYWEPWAKGSFLQRANNEAGVDAQPHSSHRKAFSVTSKELERILYAVVIESDEVNVLSQFAERLGGDPDADRAAVRKLQELDDESRTSGNTN